jgi:phosphatidylglycerol lysyltransferase
MDLSHDYISLDSIPIGGYNYLIYPREAALPDIVVALTRADSGDRLLDYFKPGS